MTERVEEVRMLALVPAEMQGRIRRQLAPLGVTIDFVVRATDLSQLAEGPTSYHVALVPAVLPDTGWWSLWAEIRLRDPRPEVVVYSQTSSFSLWSGVLEMGGFDVIVEPFTDAELQGAVLRAARSFRLGRRKENEVD